MDRILYLEIIIRPHLTIFCCFYLRIESCAYYNYNTHSWACSVYIIYYIRIFCVVPRVISLSNKIRNLHINKAESYMSCIYYKWDLLWYEKVTIVHASRVC